MRRLLRALALLAAAGTALAWWTRRPDRDEAPPQWVRLPADVTQDDIDWLAEFGSRR